MVNTLVPLGDRQFRFVVIADTHINQTDDHASSFFKLNRLANERAAVAFAIANRYQPDFVIHLGDIVHPIPSHPDFGQAAENYRTLAAQFACPIYLTPGNHDIGDKPWPLAPVAQIEPSFIKAYEKEFGRQWLCWTHGDCSFFILNTSLFNSELPQESEQKEWFERVLSEAKGRKFLSLHYPPYVRDAGEASHYDNIDEPERSWLLKLVSDYQIEAIFCGHVHNLWYDQYADTEMYLLPSTAFVRQDYSEMQRVCPPGEEGGRQDINKLGFFVVDVFDQGHRASFVRLPEKKQLATSGPDGVFLEATLHSKLPPLPNLGVDLGYPWAEEVVVPPSGALDAFDSKTVRNDYPLFALFELGLSRLRIPLSDFANAKNVDRFKKLARIGIRAQVVTPGLPSPAQQDILATFGSGIEAIEIVATEENLASQAQAIKKMMAVLPACKLLLSKLRGPQDAVVDGLHYGHLVFHGWVPAEARSIERMLREHYADIDNTEALYRVRFSESPLAMAEQIDALAKVNGTRTGLLLRLATDNPALPQCDETALCVYVLEGVLAAYFYPEMRVLIEGMVDFDRGYFLRMGLIDRSFNPRTSALVLKHISALLKTYTGRFARVQKNSEHGVCYIRLEGPTETLVVLIGDNQVKDRLKQEVDTALEIGKTCWDLMDGRSIGRSNFTQARNGPSAFAIQC